MNGAIEGCVARDQKNFELGPLGFDVLDQLNAGAIGQTDVQEQNVVPATLAGEQGVVPPMLDFYTVVVHLQQFAQRIARVAIVVNEQYPKCEVGFIHCQRIQT